MDHRTVWRLTLEFCLSEQFAHLGVADGAAADGGLQVDPAIRRRTAADIDKGVANGGAGHLFGRVDCADNRVLRVFHINYRARFDALAGMVSYSDHACATVLAQFCDETADLGGANIERGDHIVSGQNLTFPLSCPQSLFLSYVRYCP